MNKFLIGFFAAASLVAAHADNISGSIGTAPANLNLNDYEGFAFYGNTKVPLFNHVTPTPSTDLANIASFSNLTAIGASTAISTSGGSPETVTYTNGTATPQSSVTNSGGFYFDQGPANAPGTGTGFSLTTKLFATSETFQFLLQGYNAQFNLTATLNDVAGTTFSLSNVILPTDWSGTATNGTGNTDGIFTLTVNGAIGQTLTFSDVIGTSMGTNGNAGIAAITVQSVPEPSTYVLMFMGVVALGVCQRRGKKLRV